MKHDRRHSSDDDAKLGSGKEITMAKELYGPPRQRFLLPLDIGDPGVHRSFICQVGRVSSVRKATRSQIDWQ